MQENSPITAKPIKFDWSPSFSIFSAENFLQSVSDEYGWIGGFNQSEEMVCVLPYTIIKKGPIRMARFRVETILIDPNLPVNDEKEFLNCVVDFLRKESIDIIIPASTNCLFRTYPDKATAAPYGSHIIDLTQSESTLWKNVHQKHRNVIKSAEKKGVKILEGPEILEKAYEIIKETFDRSKLKLMGLNSFNRMISGLGEYVKILVAEYDGELQGCAVLPFSEYRAYYSYGGTKSHHLTGAMNYLQWYSILLFKEMGVRSYDFCGARISPEIGSKAAKLIMYKERFGGRLYGGYIWKYPINQLKAPIYQLGVKLLRKGDIVDAEHKKLPFFKLGGNGTFEFDTEYHKIEGKEDNYETGNTGF
jgi:lipid II:glycine glycyltransferase (peptidoglycan interpeptide bridge formation enzyme)